MICASIRVNLAVTNEGNDLYFGKVRSYVTEIESRWNNYDGDPYHFGFLDFAINNIVFLLPGKTKVITAEFFRRGLAHKIRCAAIAPGYVGTEMVRGMNQKALEKILNNVPIKRLIEPEEVASLVCEIYRNEALAGETFFIHGGLRLGSKG